MNAVMWDAIRRMHPSHFHTLTTNAATGFDACDLCQGSIELSGQDIMEYGCSGAPTVEKFSAICVFVFSEPPNIFYDMCMQIFNQKCPMVLNLLSASPPPQTVGEICAAISMC